MRVSTTSLKKACRKLGVDRIDAWYDRRLKTGQLGVTFADDSFVIADFASDVVLECYLKNARWVRNARTIEQKDRA